MRDGNELAWQPYSRELLERLTGEGKTVLVDFTADWCLTCKSNEAIALNTAQTKEFIQSQGIATLKADKTQPAPDVDELLKLLGNKAGSIPCYAIFPAGNPNRPILLDGFFTSPEPGSQDWDRLQSAVESIHLPNHGFLCVIGADSGKLLCHPELRRNPQIGKMFLGLATLNTDRGAQRILASEGRGWATMPDGTHRIAVRDLPEIRAKVLVHQRDEGIRAAVEPARKGQPSEVCSAGSPAPRRP